MTTPERLLADRAPARVRAVLAPAVLVAAWAGAAAAPAAEPPPGQPMVFPFADPQAMFDRFFGEPTEDEKRQLAEIEVSPGEERRQGEAVVEAYLAHLRRQGIRAVSRGREADYLRELVDAVRPHMQEGDRYRTIRVYVAQSPECDARAFPGGTLVFFRGLLETAESEAALVGIVGHELSHLDRGHLLGRIRRMKLAEKTFSRPGQAFSPQEFFKSGAAALRMWTRPFEPELEFEADRDGAEWAYLAGYDPREMARLFLSVEGRRQGPQLPLPEFLRSHPLPRDRHAAILRLYEELARTEPREGLYVGKENLRRRVARRRREFPE